ncbi:hypothetical protein MTP09_07065 [Chryseobacterium suipulveris]|uniref:Uncharacterized protein n=1 Tax=Chryseobacterium suipulveris TaxID=2929800 RepID=A0ABY4BT67_9FLAO|nr:hypothetical protein [Chryseobacterium suipulveris]UOE42387.1 hypothetical protein MTP09_07065 [Chryseobacterium suipulveris]
MKTLNLPLLRSWLYLLLLLLQTFGFYEADKKADTLIKTARREYKIK